MNVTHEQISDDLKRALYVTNERVETAIFLALAVLGLRSWWLSYQSNPLEEPAAA